MERRRDHFQFHTFTMTFGRRWNLAMQDMQIWTFLPNDKGRSTKKYSFSCYHDDPVYKSNTRTLSMHSTHGHDNAFLEA